jgi:hypothetical protein
MTEHETWKAIPGATGYEASNLGRVRSVPRQFIRANGWPFSVRGRVLAQADDGRGYAVVKVHARPRNVAHVHRLVALAFVGPRPDGAEVCHINGIKRDNRAANLRYGTRSDNQQDRTRHGTNGHKLTAADVFVIRERRAAGEKIAAIAADFEITDVMVSKIARRVLWKTVA